MLGVLSVGEAGQTPKDFSLEDNVVAKLVVKLLNFNRMRVKLYYGSLLTFVTCGRQ